jgi:hypothetical protein
MTRRYRLNAPGVWNVAQERHLTKSAALFNLGKGEFVLFGSPLMDPKLAVKQYPKRVRQFALLRNNLAPVDMEVPHSIQTMQLVISQRRQNGNRTQQRNQFVI